MKASLKQNLRPLFVSDTLGRSRITTDKDNLHSAICCRSSNDLKVLCIAQESQRGGTKRRERNNGAELCGWRFYENIAPQWREWVAPKTLQWPGHERNF